MRERFLKKEHRASRLRCKGSPSVLVPTPACKVAPRHSRDMTMPPAKRPSPAAVPVGGIPASSHDRILAAAKHLFATRGYESSSTVAIARAAGTSESQLMKHFGSKEGLLE